MRRVVEQHQPRVHGIAEVDDVEAARRLVKAAKTPEAFWAVQQSFFKSQQDVVAKQTEAFGKFYADWLKDTSAPMADVMKPFLGKAA